MDPDIVGTSEKAGSMLLPGVPHNARRSSFEARFGIGG